MGQPFWGMMFLPFATSPDLALPLVFIPLPLLFFCPFLSLASPFSPLLFSAYLSSPLPACFSASPSLTSHLQPLSLAFSARLTVVFLVGYSRGVTGCFFLLLCLLEVPLLHPYHK